MTNSSTVKVLARSVRENLNKAGVKEVMFEGITAGDKDFSALVAKLKKENVDFVYFGGYYPEMGQILRQAKQSGLNIRFMGPEGVGNSSLSNIAGEASEGMLVTLPKRYDQVPTNKPIVDAIKAKKRRSNRSVRLDYVCGNSRLDDSNGAYREPRARRFG
ncbi:Leu/Ile/Val/Thr-binding protein precursor [Providencia stuartii]|nr:Leu/Ile/Val/Thr-binding protein precursor [Providencia stuartii]